MPEIHYLPTVEAQPTGRRNHKPTVLLEGWTHDTAAVTCPVCLENIERLGATQTPTKGGAR